MDVTYLSDSVLLVLTRSLEIKLLYTRKFDYGLYNPDTWKPAAPTTESVKAEESKLEAAWRPPSLIDEGLFVGNLAQSEYGPTYK